jgi:hypothetical protein
METTRRVALFLCLAGFALCQTDQGRIVGTITDVNGAVIPSAKVLVKNQRTGTERSVTANEQGRFIITNLSAAQYSVSSTAAGLGTTEVEIVLTAAQERTVNLSLQPAMLQQTITVSGGDLVVIDLSSARIGANINEREVSTLPLNGRQLSQLYLLAPGAQTAGGGSFDNIRFSGRANQQNAVRFDGIEGSSVIDSSPGNLNGESSTGFRLQSSLENVQEFRVESSNYPAEYGTGSSAQISVVTKSGGNELHGALFEYVRNSSLDARNFFDGSMKSPLRLNQFGGSLGGPIVANKFFFFASYEALRQRAGVNILEAVPSAAARARAVPSIAPLMDAYPTGGTPTSNPDLDLYRLSASNQVDENYGSLRLDYHINDKYSLTARYFRDQGEATAPLNVTGNYQHVTAVPQNGMVSLQQILSPAVINEVKAGFNGAKTRLNGVAPPVNEIPLSALSIDFTGTASIAGIGGQGVSGGAARIGGLIRSNSAQNGRGVPYTAYTLTFSDQLSWIRQNHSVKFGVEVRPIRMYTDRLGGTTYTYSNLNDLLGNRPSSVQVIGDVSAPNPLHGGATGNRFLKQTYYIGYAQDEWKIRPNFTMNYGLRYEFYSVLREDRNLFTFFDMAKGELDTDPNRPWYSSSKMNFGPRLAFTWAPGKLKNNTVLRFGAGYYYGPGQTEDQVQPIDSDRVTVTAPNATFPVDSQKIIDSFNLNTFKGFAPRVYAPGYRLPERILSYTASLQQQLAAGTVLTVAYVGSQGRNLFLRSWTNVVTGVTMNPPTGTGTPVLEYGDRFAQMDYKASGGTDHYDSLQVTANRRFSRGLTVGSQWTWGHSLGNTGGSNEAQTQTDPFNFERDRGNNAFDVRHSFNTSAMYDLPFGKRHKFLSGANGALLAVVGDWEIGGVINARTGMPIDLTLARNDLAYRVDSTGATVGNPIVSGGTVLTSPIINNPYGGAFRNNRRPDMVAGVSPFLTSATDKRVLLNPAAFAIPAPGSFGNMGRWALHGPSLSQFDLTLHKQFNLTEKVNLEFRSEMYNIFNHTNFANPVSRLNNALGMGANQLQPGQPFTAAAAGGTFGLSTPTVTKDVGLGASRQIQLSLRLNF